MNDFKKLLEKYADIAIKIGINIEPNQTLVINSPIECAEFVRIIANKAYDAGAKNVHVKWNDEELSLIKYMKAPLKLRRIPCLGSRGIRKFGKRKCGLFIYICFKS